MHMNLGSNEFLVVLRGALPTKIPYSNPCLLGPKSEPYLYAMAPLNFEMKYVDRTKRSQEKGMKMAF